MAVRETEDPPRGLEQHQHDDAADDDVEIGRVARPLDEIALEDPVVTGTGQRPGRPSPIPTPPSLPMAGAAFSSQVDQESEQQQEADVQRTRDQRRAVEGGDEQLEGRKQRATASSRPERKATWRAGRRVR